MTDSHQPNQNFLILNLFLHYVKNFLASLCSSVFIILLSRYSFLIASLLPIKVILILNNKKIPNYIESIFPSISFENLIFSLCIVSFIFFIIHFVCEKIIRTFQNKILTETSRDRSNLDFTKGEKFVIEMSFTKMSESLAYIVFILLSILLYLLVFFELAIFILAFILLIAITLFFLKSSLKYNQRLITISSIVANLFFLFAFLFIVYLHLYFDEYNILISVISLLIFRQSTSYIVNILNSFMFFSKHYTKIQLLILR